MSKGMLLDYMTVGEILADVPEGKIWIFVDNSSGIPVIKGKLHDGSIITFEGKE